MSLCGSLAQPAINTKSRRHVNFIPPSSASLKTPAIASPSAKLKVAFGSRFFRRLLLNLRCLVSLFALQVCKDQLPQLHQLLNLLLHNLVADLQRLHAPIARLRHGAELTEDGLLARQLAPLQTGGTKRTESRVEAGLRPVF